MATVLGCALVAMGVALQARADPKLTRAEEIAEQTRKDGVTQQKEALARETGRSTTPSTGAATSGDDDGLSAEEKRRRSRISVMCGRMSKLLEGGDTRSTLALLGSDPAVDDAQFSARAARNRLTLWSNACGLSKTEEAKAAKVLGLVPERREPAPATKPTPTPLPVRKPTVSAAPAKPPTPPAASVAWVVHFARGTTLVLDDVAWTSKTRMLGSRRGTIQVEGHATEHESPTQTAEALALARAEVFKRALTSHGIAEARIRVTSAGASRPSASPSLSDAVPRNARVEVSVLP